MQIPSSLEKALILGKMEGKRRRIQSATRWVDSVVMGVLLEDLRLEADQQWENLSRRLLRVDHYLIKSLRKQCKCIAREISLKFKCNTIFLQQRSPSWELLNVYYKWEVFSPLIKCISKQYKYESTVAKICFYNCLIWFSALWLLLFYMAIQNCYVW